MAEDVGGHQTLHGPGGIARADERSACKAHASERRSRMLGEAPTTLRAEDLIDEFNQRSMILIVTRNLLKAPWAATPIVGLLDGDRVEHRPTPRMFTGRQGGRAACEVTREFG